MKRLLLVVMMLASATIFAQGTVSGTVFDSEMNGPLPGANVILSGTSTGVTTDFDGNFSIDVPQSSGTLEISFVGYKTKNLPFTIVDGEADLGGPGVLHADL